MKKYKSIYVHTYINVNEMVNRPKYDIKLENGNEEISEDLLDLDVINVFISCKDILESTSVLMKFLNFNKIDIVSIMAAENSFTFNKLIIIHKTGE